MTRIPIGEIMSDELQNLAEVDSAQATDVTATSEQVSVSPEITENQEEVVQEEKKFSQAELDAMIGKRLAREQRKWEREQHAKFLEQKAVSEKTELDISKYETPESYAEALAEKRVQELIIQREREKQEASLLEAYHEKEEEVRNKYDDFDQVAYNPNLSITTVMAQTIHASDIGPDVAYYLGINPKEASRISNLPPLLQAKEIGKIEAKLTDAPLVKKTSSAPAPIKPVTARVVNTAITDTTDPRSIQSMTTSEWIEAERKRQIAKLKSTRIN